MSTEAVATYYGDDDELHLAFNFPPLFAPWLADRWRGLHRGHRRRPRPPGRLADMGAVQPRQSPAPHPLRPVRGPGRRGPGHDGPAQRGPGPGRRRAAAHPAGDAVRLPGRRARTGRRRHPRGPARGPGWAGRLPGPAARGTGRTTTGGRRPTGSRTVAAASHPRPTCATGRHQVGRPRIDPPPLPAGHRPAARHPGAVTGILRTARRHPRVSSATAASSTVTPSTCWSTSRGASVDVGRHRAASGRTCCWRRTTRTRRRVHRGARTRSGRRHPRRVTAAGRGGTAGRRRRTDQSQVSCQKSTAPKSPSDIEWSSSWPLWRMQQTSVPIHGPRSMQCTAPQRCHCVCGRAGQVVEIEVVVVPVTEDPLRVWFDGHCSFCPLCCRSGGVPTAVLPCTRSGSTGHTNSRTGRGAPVAGSPNCN